MRNFLGLALGIGLLLFGLILMIYGLTTPATIANQTYVIGSLLVGLIMFLAGVYMLFRFSKEMSSDNDEQPTKIKIEADNGNTSDDQVPKTSNSKTYLATPKQRFKAYLLDTIIGIITLFLIGGSANIGGFGQSLSIILALGFIATQFYFFSKSTTPGKYFFDMVVVNKENGKPVGYWKMLLRQVIALPISQLIFGLGIFWIFRDNENQGWHDKIINDYVVKISIPTVPSEKARYLKR